MTSLSVTPPRAAAIPFRLRLRRPSPRALLTGAALLTYLVVAWYVVGYAHSIIGDAWSRVGNSYYVLYSRDPKLASIGFVWNPLPSLALLPLLPLRGIWPALISTGFAGSIESALCMAAAVWQLDGIATDWHAGTKARALVVLAFAFNPMTVYYGANGMSEAMFILTLLVTARYLARWALGGGAAPLSIAGLALAAAYLARYEAAAAALGGALAVGFVHALRGKRLSAAAFRPGRTSARRPGWSPRPRTIAGARAALRAAGHEAAADLLVFGVPFLIAFAGWALASWLIVGDPFQQFSSAYGLSSQLTVAQSSISTTTGQGTAAAPLWVVRQVVALQPGIAALALVAAGIALLRDDRRRAMILPAAGVLGAVVAFSAFGFLTGRTLGWLRYFIVLIPLGAVLALAIAAPVATGDQARTPVAAPSRAGRRGRERSRRERERASRDPEPASRNREPASPARGARWARRAAAGIPAIAVLAFAASWPSSGLAAIDTSLNPPFGGEAFQLRPVLFGETAEVIEPTGQYEVGRQAAAFLDGLHLGPGTVLVDSAMGFPIVLQSADPDQFVITSDRDFAQAVADPQSFGVRYLLVPEDVGYQSLDAINRAYPGIYENGAPFLTLVQQLSSGGNNWRIYQVVR